LTLGETPPCKQSCFRQVLALVPGADHVLSNTTTSSWSNLEESRNRFLRVVGKKTRPLLDFMASVYETWVYPAVRNLYGGWHSTSLEQLAHDVSGIVGSRDGSFWTRPAVREPTGAALLLRQGPFLALISAGACCGEASIMSKGYIFPTFTSPVLRWRRCRFGLACSPPPD
jgi:hypothetical protein